LAFANPSQQKFLRYSAFQHRVYQQHVAAFYVGAPTESHFTPRVASLLNVTHVLADKVANRRRVDMPYQVRSEYEPAIQRNHYIQPLAVAHSRNLPP
jgi:hypothetical protein